MARRRENSSKAMDAPSESGPEAKFFTPPVGAWLSPASHMACLGLIVLAMASTTYNLDDIKMTLFLWFGPVLGLVALNSMIRGWIPTPHRAVGFGLVAYLAITIVSMMGSEFSWAGRSRVLFYFAGAGFFLSGMSLGARPRIARVALMFFGVMVLIVNLFGFIQYDVFKSGESILSGLYDSVYGTHVGPSPSALQHMLYTFKVDTTTRLMSTILNRDFYAAFCLLYLPLLAVLALTSRGWLMRSVGLATIFLSLASIFLCKSKGEYIIAVVQIALFIGLYAMAVRRSPVRGPYLAAWGGGTAMFFSVLAFVNSPSLLSQLKTLSYSFASRRIIFSGALDIFREFPVLGSGPGTFRLYFPRFRSADYFEHEISNVTIFAHNYFLDILSETGVLGMAAYLAFAGSLAVLALRMIFITERPELRLMLIGATCGLFGMFGSNLTSPNAQWPIGAVGLWTMLGFTAGLVRQGEASGAPVTRPARPEAYTSGRTRIGYAALCVGAIALILCLNQGSISWRSSVFYNRGKQAFESYRPAAMEIILKKHKADPAEIARLRGVFEASISNFENAIKADPYHLSAYYQLGSLHNLLANLLPERSEENLAQSLNAYVALETLSPDYAELPYNLGVIYFRLSGNSASALEGLGDDQVEEAAHLREEVASYRELSRKHFTRMSELSRKPEVIQRLGETYFDAGDFELARNMFARGMELYPDNFGIARYFRLSSQQAGDVRGQIEGAGALWLMRPGQVDLLYGQSYSALDLALKNAELDLAVDLMDLALERQPVDPELHARRVVLGTAQRDPAEVLDAAATYLRLGGAKTEILLEGARAARELGRVDMEREFIARSGESSDGSGSPPANPPNVR